MKLIPNIITITQSTISLLPIDSTIPALMNLGFLSYSVRAFLLSLVSLARTEEILTTCFLSLKPTTFLAISCVVSLVYSHVPVDVQRLHQSSSGILALSLYHNDYPQRTIWLLSCVILKYRVWRLYLLWPGSDLSYVDLYVIQFFSFLHLVKSTSLS